MWREVGDRKRAIVLITRMNWCVTVPIFEKTARPDYATYDLLKEYYLDEEEDLYWGEQQLELIEAIGKQNWLVQQL